MEKQKGEYASVLDQNFRTALFFWQSNPESSEAIDKVRGLIYEVSDLEMGISFKIKDDILRSSEAKRGILPGDLRRFAKHEGHSFVFNLGAKKGREGEFTLTAKMLYGQPYLLFHGRHDGMIGIFRPHEINSLEVRPR